MGANGQIAIDLKAPNKFIGLINGHFRNLNWRYIDKVSNYIDRDYMAIVTYL
jgi:hypothetical protein